MRSKAPELHLLALIFILHLLPSPLLAQDRYNTSYYAPLNSSLRRAYVALQTWKCTFTSDPYNLTSDWYGLDVCSYTGVFCAPALDNSKVLTVAGIDLTHGGISGILHERLCLLTDLAILHLNSNRFSGTLPSSFRHLRLLHELDVSNNLLSGKFPSVVLSLPSLRYLDIRFNMFSGDVPAELFSLPLDALFINSNQFCFSLPDNLGNSPASVLVLGDNHLTGQLPATICNMAPTLNELIISNTYLESCIPTTIGDLENLIVLDLSSNNFVGPLPITLGNLKNIEQLNVASNKLSGAISYDVCAMNGLVNFTYADNYFYGNPPRSCNGVEIMDGHRNCFEQAGDQRSEPECSQFLSRPVQCAS